MVFIIIVIPMLLYRLGLSIKDENGRTPIHSAFRLSNNSNNNRLEAEKVFDIDMDFGDKVIDTFLQS